MASRPGTVICVEARQPASSIRPGQGASWSESLQNLGGNIWKPSSKVPPHLIKGRAYRKCLLYRAGLAPCHHQGWPSVPPDLSWYPAPPW